VIETDNDELSHTDFAPFRVLAAMPWAMSAHIVYMAIDSTAPATLSSRVISQVIRGTIGFDGVLVSDDLSMQALGGEIGERAERALAAGCDLVLHCNGDRGEMETIASATGRIAARTADRLARSEAMRRASGPRPFDRSKAEARLDTLLVGSRVSDLVAD